MKDDDDFGLTDAIKKTERERDWLPLAILAASALFAWMSGYRDFSHVSAFEGFAGLALFAGLRGIYQNKVTILRLEKRREFMARKEREADWVLSQTASVSHVAEVDR
ncbi:hypothetical protein BMI91_16960 [Thioclava sediminum]|uniref:YiaAB two helix domain-containing protein n=1 Tax=Thioclava sediminum TaxID=1915319 RepID=A0ABX3MUA8_9RHOB|nr:hypothetical protein [Thioclava sediminum]OOY23133.1 hypothetical protein BMI91_16960 [Thioclava sediminum]